MNRLFFRICFGLILACLPLRAWCADAAPAAYVLPNGLRVLVRERHASPLVAIDLWVRAGAREEGPDEYGCAHFLEHTLFKGTTTRRSGDADAAIEDLGATLDAATGPDYAHFYTTVASTHFTAALAILADVVRNATLPEAEIEKERGVILDELAEHAADPVNRLTDLLYSGAFHGLPYQRSPGGSPDAISARSRDALVAFYHRCYRPERCTLVIVGDCSVAQASAEAQRAFGDWRAPAALTSPAGASTGSAQDRANLPEQSDSAASAPIQARIAGSNGMVGIGFRAPAARDFQMASAGLVLSAILENSLHDKQLTGSASNGINAALQFTPRQDPGLFVITSGLSIGRADASASAKLEASLLDRLRDLRAQPPDAEEIADAKIAVLGRLQFDTETNAGLARAIGYADITGGEPPEALRATIRQLRRTDLQRFIQQFLDPERRIAAHLLPTEDITRGAR